MSALLAFFSGGKMALIVAGVVAALGIIWRVLAGAKKSGVDAQKAKEAAAREMDLEKIKRAADAGSRVKPGGVPDDPYDRDRRGKP